MEIYHVLLSSRPPYLVYISKRPFFGSLYLSRALLTCGAFSNLDAEDDQQKIVPEETGTLLLFFTSFSSTCIWCLSSFLICGICNLMQQLYF